TALRQGRDLALAEHIPGVPGLPGSVFDIKWAIRQNETVAFRIEPGRHGGDILGASPTAVKAEDQRSRGAGLIRLKVEILQPSGPTPHLPHEYSNARAHPAGQTPLQL